MQNRKGIGIVTVLAFLALALILFAGMAITFQTSAAREASEFDEQQVLLMAQSYSELVNGKLSSDEELQRKMIDNANDNGNLISNSEIKDISTSVKYDAGSLGCSETVDEITKTEVCILPVDIETTSTLSRISRKPVSRTIKNTAEITRTIVTTTAGGETSGLGDYLKYALVTAPDSSYKYDFQELSGQGYLVDNNNKFNEIRIKGDVALNVDVSSMKVNPIPSYVVANKECDKKLITSSCRISHQLTNAHLNISVGSSGADDKPIFIVVENGVEFKSSNINVHVGKNQSVIFYLEGDLKFNDTKIDRQPVGEDEGLVLIMGNGNNQLIFNNKDGVSNYEGMVYLPWGIVRDETKFDSYYLANSEINGVVITGKVVMASEDTSKFSIEWEFQNIGNLCSGVTYCPFPSEEGEGGTGEVTTTTTYSSGGIQYAK